MTSADNDSEAVDGDVRGSRTAALRALVELQVTPRAAIATLSSYNWDSPDDLVILAPGDIVRLLNKYLRSEITSEDWRLWAEALEGRDDIGFSEESGDIVKEFIFQSATSEIFEPLTDSLARAWISRLSGDKL